MRPVSGARARSRLLPLAAWAGLLLSGAAARAESCEEELGRRRAQVLADRCLDVSPATHPPCNARNSCALIDGEIRRGCAVLEADAPDWCRAAGEE